MTQPAKSRTGLWVALGGGALALLLICCIGGVVGFTVWRANRTPTAAPTLAPSPSPSESLASCLIGSWRYQYEPFTGSLHGSPSMRWSSMEGALEITFNGAGEMRVTNNMLLLGVNSGVHRVRRGGTATVSYQLTGDTILYGPASAKGTSTYTIDHVPQGGPVERDLWTTSPDRISCWGRSSLTLSGTASDGKPYRNTFNYFS